MKNVLAVVALLAGLCSLDDVLPDFAVDCQADNRIVHGIFCRQLLLSDAAFTIAVSNFSNRDFVKLGTWELSAMNAPAFDGHVIIVVGSRAEKKMGRVDARLEIAAMQNAQSITDRSNEQFKRNPMRQVATTARAIGDNSSVSANVQCSFPWDATIGHFASDVIKKSNRQRDGLPLVAAFPGAESCFAAPDFARLSNEMAVTDFTDSISRIVAHSGPSFQGSGCRGGVF